MSSATDNINKEQNDSDTLDDEYINNTMKDVKYNHNIPKFWLIGLIRQCVIVGYIQCTHKYTLANGFTIQSLLSLHY